MCSCMFGPKKQMCLVWQQSCRFGTVPNILPSLLLSLLSFLNGIVKYIWKMLITLFLKVAWPEVVYSLSKMYTKRNVKTTTCGFRGTSVQTTALWLLSFCHKEVGRFGTISPCHSRRPCTEVIEVVLLYWSPLKSGKMWSLPDFTN